VPGWIEVIRPGPLATIQDLGRPGLGHLGVRCCGAADAASLRLANRLAGNPEGAAGLEITFGRAEVRAGQPCRVALAGAPVPVRVTRPATPAGPASPAGPAGPASPAPSGPAAPGPAGPDTPAPASTAGPDEPGEPGFGTGFWLPAGGVLRLGASRAGLRTYLAVRGGIAVPPVLGSRSADLVSGLGPPPLRPGDRLPVGGPGQEGQRGRGELAATGLAGTGLAGTELAGTGLPGTELAGTGLAGTEVTRGPVLLTVIPGPRADWFAADALSLLCGGDYTVSTDSDRTGLRLAGPPLRRASARELPSEGLVPGALQVPPDGAPILLLADHPVTGGYPVIAVVRSADIGRAAQLRPGQQVRFAVSGR
jgi:biotin-dependent carboxylase-like uncharacterized protein